MLNKILVSVFAMLVLAITASTFASSTPHLSGIGVIDDFDETEPDSATWTTTGTLGPLGVSHDDGVVKIDATLGFNQVYTTRTQKVKIGQMVSAEMARLDTNTLKQDRVITGLVLCDVNNFRCSGEQSDQMALNWAQNNGFIQSGPGPNEPGSRPE